MFAIETRTEETYRVLDAVSTSFDTMIHMRVESDSAQGWHAVVSTDDVANLAKLGTCRAEIAVHGPQILVGAEFTALPIDSEWIMLPEETPVPSRRGLLASAH